MPCFARKVSIARTHASGCSICRKCVVSGIASYSTGVSSATALLMQRRERSAFDVRIGADEFHRSLHLGRASAIATDRDFPRTRALPARADMRGSIRRSRALHAASRAPSAIGLGTPSREATVRDANCFAKSRGVWIALGALARANRELILVALLKHCAADGHRADRSADRTAPARAIDAGCSSACRIAISPDSEWKTPATGLAPNSRSTPASILSRSATKCAMSWPAPPCSGFSP